MTLPIISLANSNSATAAGELETARQVVHACEHVGFFYIKDFSHLLPDEVFQALDTSARTFFDLPAEKKTEISMERGGSAWRGSFPCGVELTSGRPDLKEGLYFGTEMSQAEARNRPLHGPNQFPDERDCPGMKDAVVEYMKGCKRIGQKLMSLIALGLELESSDYFVRNNITREPLELFRIFHYPTRERLVKDIAALGSSSKNTNHEKLEKVRRGMQNALATGEAGVGEHNDYGLLTCLKIDGVGGLQVRHLHNPNEWIDVTPIEGTLVINLGDILEAMTGGLFRSTPHRVIQPKEMQQQKVQRVSMPYFFDPQVDCVLRPLPLSAAMKERARQAVERRAKSGFKRWDDQSKSSLLLAPASRETYGEYVLNKVRKVFPNLFDAQLKSKL